MYKLIKVADNFTTLSDAEKEALFNNYEQASPSELYKLGKFKVAVESEDETDTPTKVQLTAVPNNLLCLPRELFGDSFDKINNVTVTDTIQKNSKIVYFVTKDLKDYYTFYDSKFVRLSAMDVDTVLKEGIDASSLGAITPTQWATFYDSKNDIDGIGIGFAISQTNSAQVPSIDKLSVTVDIRGAWSKAINGTDYSYGYTGNSTLKFNILSDGDFKFNYQITQNSII